MTEWTGSKTASPVWHAMSLWVPEDIPWRLFDRKQLDPDIVKLIKAASMVEHNARHYTRYLCNVFHDDEEFRKLALEWGDAEVQHGQTLGRWAKLADPDFDFDSRFKRFADGFHIDTEVSNSVRGSLTGEFLARCVVETGTSSFYTAVRQATNEPVLKELCRNIAADELRHYKTFYELSQRHLQRERIGLGSRLRVVVSRVIETDDNELAYAYHAANEKAGNFDHKRNHRAYARRVYGLYSPYLIERIGAMLLKIVGLRPHGWINQIIAKYGYRFMQARSRRYAALGV